MLSISWFSPWESLNKNILLAKRGMVPIVLDAGVFKNAFWMGCIHFSIIGSRLGSKKLSPMSDIYAFAMIVYEMSGRCHEI